MKSRSSVLTFLAAIFISNAILHGQPTDLSGQLDQIRILLKLDESDTPEEKNIKSKLQDAMARWQQMLDRDKLTGFAGYGARNMGVELSAVPELEAKINLFVKSVSDEIIRREDAKIAEGEALITQVGEQLKNAKKAEDLDALILALSKSKGADYGNNPKLSALYRELQGSLQIVGNWQEYLMAEETGDTKNCRRKLEQISSQLSSNPVIPRSIVLRLLNPSVRVGITSKDTDTSKRRASLDEIIAKLTESGDSATGLAEFKSIGEVNNGGSDYRSMLRSIQMVDDLRKLELSMSEAEVFANIRGSIQKVQSQSRYLFTRAFDQIALNAIARSYGVETFSAKDISARKVLESIASDARDKQDLPKLRQAIVSLDNLGPKIYGKGFQKRTYDLKIISLLELGKAAEKRNDFEAAASAYLEASSIDGLYLKREIGYTKLADIKQKSPDKVAQVMAKAEEKRQRSETARYAAELDSRDRMMDRRMPYESRRNVTMMRLMIQEVVAEFLKEKRLESISPAEKAIKPKAAQEKK